MSHTWTTSVSATLIVMAGSACHLSDQLSARQAGDPCLTDGARAEQFVCRGGVWTPVDMADMPTMSSDMSDDMGTTPRDMPAEMGCVGESDAEICAMLGRCNIEMSVVDRCDKVRNVTCPGNCAQGICIPATGLCEGDCMPTACPTDVMCGRVSNGCGATQLCSRCDPGTMCDPDQGICVCEAPDPESVCDPTQCGTITTLNICGEMVDVECGACDSGFCNPQARRCGSIELFASPPRETRDLARFGHSLDLDGPYLIVGAPGEVQPLGVGNAYIFERSMGTWLMHYNVREQSSTSAAPYNGFAMGASVAIDRTDQLAIVGKSYIDASEPFDGRVKLLYLNDRTWTDGLTLSGEGRNAGAVVTMAPGFAALGSPGDSPSDSGLVRAFSFVNGDPTQPMTSEFGSMLGGDRIGESIALTESFLIFGAPGHAGQGACFITDYSPAREQWEGLETVAAASSASLGDTEFCARVAASEEIFVASSTKRDSDNSAVGAVQIFDVSSHAFKQEILDPDSSPTGGFGMTLHITSDGVLLIGNPRADSALGSESGVVYVYKQSSTGDYTLFTQIRSQNPTSGGHFGHAIASEGNFIVIGAPGELAGDMFEAGNLYTLTLP